MATTYYIKVNIESAGTDYQANKNQDISKSLAGHMWYEIYEKDGNGNIINTLNAGYTSHGVVNNDKTAYLGDSAYSSQEIAITQEQFKTLKDFGELKYDSVLDKFVPPELATQNGFGNDDYGVFTNSCIDYTWKALELIGINKDGYEGNLIPMNNTDNIDDLIQNINKIDSASNLLEAQFNDFMSSSNETVDYIDWITDSNTSINIDDFSLVGYLKVMGANSITNDNQTYTIQSGDNLSQIAQTNNTTIDKIIEDNPWLTQENRISQDGSYALIKPGEKLNLTVDDKTTTYGIDENSTITPEYQIDLTTNTVIPLQPNQTISHIAQNTPYNSIDLLEYNNLTLEQAKNLPVGFEVQIPKDVTVVDGEYGAIKIYEGYDNTGVIVTPNEKITYDENSDLLIYGDNDKITFTDTNDIYQEWLKDTDGNIYKSLESNNDFTITYDNTKTVTNIEILSDNVSLDEIANLTPYSKEDLQAFNFLDGDTVDSNTNFRLLVLKDVGFNNGFYGMRQVS